MLTFFYPQGIIVSHKLCKKDEIIILFEGDHFKMKDMKTRKLEC